MPGTAKALGMGNRGNPEESILGGAKYLRQLANQFSDPADVLMAYNAGPTPSHFQPKYAQAVAAQYNKLVAAHPHYIPAWRSEPQADTEEFAAG